jgi:hypothetical protein
MRSIILAYFGIGLLSAAVANTARSQTPKAPPGVTQTAALPTYPDSTSSLERLIKDILKAQMAGDGAHAQELIDTLVLPNWYTESFDEEVARAGVALYDPAASSLGAQLARYFINAQQSHPEIQAVRFAETCDDNASDHTFGLLLSRLRPVPLYEVRFIKDGKFSRLFAFVYVDGGFRFVVLPDPEKVVPHRLRALTDTSKQTEVIAGRDVPPVQTIRQGGAITAAHFINREQPEYTEVARRERIQGTIRLRHHRQGRHNLRFAGNVRKMLAFKIGL